MGGAAEYCFVPTSSGVGPPCVGIDDVTVGVADCPEPVCDFKTLVTNQMATATARITIPIVMMRV